MHPFTPRRRSQPRRATALRHLNGFGSVVVCVVDVLCNPLGSTLASKQNQFTTLPSYHRRSYLDVQRLILTVSVVYGEWVNLVMVSVYGEWVNLVMVSV